MTLLDQINQKMAVHVPVSFNDSILHNSYDDSVDFFFALSYIVCSRDAHLYNLLTFVPFVCNLSMNGEE